MLRGQSLDHLQCELLPRCPPTNARRCKRSRASTARGQPVYDGGVHIERLFRTIYLIDHFVNAAFRAELQHVLNGGEAVHPV
ncbi:hypothetical protein FAZ95_07795 [Trinickia violacea]|uniref:Tn3 transposase DDE domain-containing protein n=1 Tax=Trinickia violacea TaxID=2571746 RepID=A0A4P8ITP9_9BURK|nr:hypothetical protein FAZ95_07795 [Trinickia violacea]